MARSIRVLERVGRVAPLGLRFRDEATNSFIGKGLDVTVYWVERPERRVKAFANPSGIYTACDLPGVRELAFGAGDDRYWDSVSGMTKEYVVRVEDPAGSFLPCQFRARLPAKGLIEWDCGDRGSPPVLPRFIPLYSAPTRPVPAGMAVVRAQLLDAQRKAPAPGALLEVQAGGQPPARGLADARGRTLVIFPYPEPAGPPFGSPPASPPGSLRRPLSAQGWDIRLQASYSSRESGKGLPDLCPLLTQQSPATLLAALSPKLLLDQAQLMFGKELILRTEGYSELWVEPSGSPP